jgi:acetate kinase
MVNAGSSSVRFAVAAAVAGQGPPLISKRDHRGREGMSDEELRQLVGPAPPALVAHRVVHGGPRHFATHAFDDAVVAAVSAMTPLAPLHNPATLRWLARCQAVWPEVQQLAVFDAGFFAELPPVARTYALPAELRARFDIRRLGFHGLAHRSMWQRFAARTARPPTRVITFQLGSGCSAAALRDGRPIDTSMGFSPLEGLVMATRSGDVDPGLLLHLASEHGLSPAELANALNDRGGLAGLAEGGGDMRALLASNTPEARLAIEVYCYRARKYLGAYTAALGGCDAILIGGGVGEKAPAVRHGILAGLEELGIELAAKPAAASDTALLKLSADTSRVGVFVVPTDEESVMAEEAVAWLGRP